MRVIATTVVRESIKGRQRTGYVYDVDWDARAVTRRLPVPDPSFPESDDNPRGGVRGGRGVAVTRHGIVVANYDTFHLFDDEWGALDSFSGPLFVGMHEIEWDGERLWTTATAIDALLTVGLEDRRTDVAWDPHESELGRRAGLARREHPLDGSVDYRRRGAPLVDRCHLNGVAGRDGALIVNCGLIQPSAGAGARVRRLLGRGRADGRSVVVRLGPEGAAETLLELRDHDLPTHNGQLVGDALVAVNDSTENTFRVFDSATGAKRFDLRVPGSWLRGMEPVDARRVLVGSAPARLVLIDLEERAVTAELPLSDDPNEAVHGLVLCPPANGRA